MPFRSFALILLAIPLFAATQVPPNLQKGDPEDQIKVIVRFTQPPTEADIKSVEDLGAKAGRKLPIIKGVVFELKRALLEKVAKLENVVSIHFDAEVRPARKPSSVLADGEN